MRLSHLQRHASDFSHLLPFTEIFPQFYSFRDLFTSSFLLFSFSCSSISTTLSPKAVIESWVGHLAEPVCLNFTRTFKLDWNWHTNTHKCEISCWFCSRLNSIDDFFFAVPDKWTDVVGSFLWIQITSWVSCCFFFVLCRRPCVLTTAAAALYKYWRWWKSKLKDEVGDDEKVIKRWKMFADEWNGRCGTSKFSWEFLMTFVKFKIGTNDGVIKCRTLL